MLAPPAAKRNSEETKGYVFLIDSCVSILKQCAQNLYQLKILSFCEECCAPFKHILKPI